MWSDCWVFGDGHCALWGVFEPGWAVGWGWEESAALGWGVGVDGGALAVDRGVVVEPTQCGEVLRVGAAVVGPVGDVVDLEPIPAGTARDGACCIVTVDDESLQAGRGDAAPPPQSEGDTVRCVGCDLDHPVA